MYRNLYTMTNGRIKTVALVHPVQRYQCDNNPSQKANRLIPQDEWGAFIDRHILADGSDWIATVPRVGYRFAGSVSNADGQNESVDAARPRPLIAVIPFGIVSEEPGK